MFNSSQVAYGVSAIKALAVASSQGQKIWTIDRDNLDLALSRLNLGADTEASIRNNVNAGKVVTTHTTKINLNGWVGEGYISIDPTTGSGAYQIAGGSNGGEVKLLSNYLLLAAGGILGMSDGASGLPTNIGKPWFSEALKQKWFHSEFSKVAGLLGVGVSIALILMDDSLSVEQKIAQVILSLVTFGMGTYLTAGLATLATPVMGILLTVMLSVILAVALSILTTVISETYMSFQIRKKFEVIC